MTFRKLVATILMTIMFITAATRLLPPVMGAETEIVGTVPQLLRAVGERNAGCYETDLGKAVADAARLYLGCDIAIICGGDLAANLYPGEVTINEIKAIFPVDRSLAVATIAISDLRRILEAGLSHITMDESEKIDSLVSTYDGFPQISGFVLRYDASAPPGQRVLEVKINGLTLDLSDDSAHVTLAATEFMLNGGYGLPAVNNTPRDMTLSTVTARYISDGITGDSLKDRRILMIGADNDGLLTIVPAQYLLLLPLLFVVAYFVTGKDRRKKKYI